MITSKSNPKIKNVVKLQKSSERREQNRIIIEGRREIERAVACGFIVDTLFVCNDILKESVNIAANYVEEVTLEVFEKIAYREGSDGLLALAIPKYADLKSFKPKKNPLIIVLETVEKPGNLGAIMRTADAAGVDAVIIADPRTDLYNPNAIRASIGTIFSVPLFACSSEECINWLRENDIKIYCTYLKASIDYLEADFRQGSAIVMGTEATGISDIWVDAADQNLIIPMNGIADSLNVSVTTAIVVFEAIRQRRV
ncbi:MAG: RNA methyltransferase [Bacteroidales bacterium]|nr:RNA methyltransferase [Bacteroidales bacterium]MBR5780944.1 RNA methyltransferase [Bacteroidales bacterium]